MLKPIGDRVLVKPAAKEEMTQSGIVIPDSAKEKPQQGQVIALGHGRYEGATLVTFKEMGIEVGVTVMYSKYGPTEIKLGSEEYVVLESRDILGIIPTKK
jgi:chaperonin GroES